MDATIIVATHGGKEWLYLGDYKADQYANKYDLPVVRVHGGKSLAQARNAAADLACGKWLCFLDADDELADDYFEVMGNATGDLRAPRLLFKDEMAHTWEPFDLTKRNIAHGNPCVVGTLIQHSMFEDVGGFWEEEAYEDWSLFRRAWIMGATIEHVDTFYTASYRPASRNNTVKDPAGLVKRIQDSHTEWTREHKL